jgi:hypothetical protein
MPLPKTTQLSQVEGRIALAIDTLKQGHFTSIRGATKSYDVPYTTLRRRVRGRLARCDSRPTNRKLIDIEELTLVQ